MSANHSRRTLVAPQPAVNKNHRLALTFDPRTGEGLLAIYNGTPCEDDAGYTGVYAVFPLEQIPSLIDALKKLQDMGRSSLGERPEQVRAQQSAEVAKQ